VGDHGFGDVGGALASARAYSFPQVFFPLGFDEFPQKHRIEFEAFCFEYGKYQFGAEEGFYADFFFIRACEDDAVGTAIPDS
jgi:hypothetical protein